MSISVSANAILTLHAGANLSSDEKQALKHTLFISSCYLKIQAEQGTLHASEIEFLQSLIDDKEKDKPKKEIRKIKPSPCVGPITALVADVMAPLDLDAILGPNSVSLSAATPPPAIPSAAVVVAISSPSPIATSATTNVQLKYRLDTPNETKCRARRYGPHIPNTKPKVYFEHQCNNKPESEHNLCKTCQKYYNNKDNKDSHKRREWNGFVCGDIPDHTAIVGGKWFQKKFPKGLPEEPTTSAPSIINTMAAAETTHHEEILEPVEESVAEEAAPVKTEEWRPYTLSGVFYAIHAKNNKVYKMGQIDGKDAVLKDQYCGVFENGTINAYVDEDEVDE